MLNHQVKSALLIVFDRFFPSYALIRASSTELGDTQRTSWTRLWIRAEYDDFTDNNKTQVSYSYGNLCIFLTRIHVAGSGGYRYIKLWIITLSALVNLIKKAPFLSRPHVQGKYFCYWFSRTQTTSLWIPLRCKCGPRRPQMANQCPAYSGSGKHDRRYKSRWSTSDGCSLCDAEARYRSFYCLVWRSSSIFIFISIF